MILYDMRSRTTMYIVKCGGTYSPQEIRVQLLQICTACGYSCVFFFTCFRLVFFYFFRS